MKYCTHCGAQVNDEAVICTHCGCRVNSNSTAQKGGVNEVLGTIAKVFMILTCVSTGTSGLACLAYIPILALIGACVPVLSGLSVTFFLILCIISFGALIWCIPMTVHVFRKLRDKEPICIEMKICVLIFVNVVAGILLLCMNDKN